MIKIRVSNWNTIKFQASVRKPVGHFLSIWTINIVLQNNALVNVNYKVFWLELKIEWISEKLWVMQLFLPRRILEHSKFMKQYRYTWNQWSHFHIRKLEKEEEVKLKESRREEIRRKEFKKYKSQQRSFRWRTDRTIVYRGSKEQDRHITAGHIASHPCMDMTGSQLGNPDLLR